MSLFSRDFKHYMDVTIEKEDGERMAMVSLVRINTIRLNDIVEYLYERLDPRNNLRDPTVKVAFDALPKDTKISLATSMFIYRYCIHRILTLHKVYIPDYWQYHLTDDYYAQDITAITLKDELATEIDRKLRHMVSLRDNKKLEYVLEMEFNRVLPEIQGKEWHIATVPLSSMRFTNEKLFNKCLEEDLSYLQSYKLPRALCIKDDTMNPQTDKCYRVIDGYHRLAEVQKRTEALAAAEAVGNGDAEADVGTSGNTQCIIIYCE